MTRVKFTLQICGVALAFTLFDPCLGVEPSSKDEPKKDYRELVAQLVSPNEKPIASWKGVRLPAGYDKKAQLRIDAVRLLLRNDFEKSLPFLIGGLDDNRYCMTIDWADGDSYYNFSVGRICEDAIRSQLEVYRDKIRFSGPQEWHSYDYKVSKTWWEQRKGRSLAALQIEAIDWVIERRKAETTNDEQNREISELQELRDGIAKSGKPAKPEDMLPMVTRDEK